MAVYHYRPTGFDPLLRKARVSDICHLGFACIYCGAAWTRPLRGVAPPTAVGNLSWGQEDAARTVCDCGSRGPSLRHCGGTSLGMSQDRDIRFEIRLWGGVGCMRRGLGAETPPNPRGAYRFGDRRCERQGNAMQYSPPASLPPVCLPPPRTCP